MEENLSNITCTAIIFYGTTTDYNSENISSAKIIIWWSRSELHCFGVGSQKVFLSKHKYQVSRYWMDKVSQTCNYNKLFQITI